MFSGISCNLYSLQVLFIFWWLLQDVYTCNSYSFVIVGWLLQLFLLKVVNVHFPGSTFIQSMFVNSLHKDRFSNGWIGNFLMKVALSQNRYQ